LFKGPDIAVGKFLAKKAVMVQSRAKRACPVDTGRLRSSIARDLGGDSEGIVARVGTNVEYAPHVEFGTSRQQAQPFLRPALDAVRGGP
jgi:HK97 gp10 family phage protein